MKEICRSWTHVCITFLTKKIFLVSSYVKVIYFYNFCLFEVCWRVYFLRIKKTGNKLWSLTRVQIYLNSFDYCTSDWTFLVILYTVFVYLQLQNIYQSSFEKFYPLFLVSTLVFILVVCFNLATFCNARVSSSQWKQNLQIRIGCIYTNFWKRNHYGSKQFIEKRNYLISIRLRCWALYNQSREIKTHKTLTWTLWFVSIQYEIISLIFLWAQIPPANTKVHHFSTKNSQLRGHPLYVQSHS